MNYDIYSSVRSVVLAALGKVPYVGFLLRGLADALWPDGSEVVFDQIKQDIDKAIDQKIAIDHYKDLREDLQGIYNLLERYLIAVGAQLSDGDIQTRLEALIAKCAADMPKFQGTQHPDSTVALLPLFVQLGNVHLGALRDSAKLKARQSNTSPNPAEFQEYLDRYSSWVTAQYNKGRSLIPRVEGDVVADWNAQNRYTRNLQLMVIDFQQMWPSFRPDDTVPAPRLTREIYSDAMGTTGKVTTSTNAALAGGDVPLTAVHAWGTRRFGMAGYDGRTVAAIQPFYGQSAGQLMGSTRTAELRKDFDLVASHPVVAAYAMSGDLFSSFEFLYQDGRKSGEFPTRPMPGDRWYWGFDGHILSSFTVMGISRYYSTKEVDAAECAAFGFRLVDSYSSPPPGLIAPPAFQNLSVTQQAAKPLYALRKSTGNGDFFDYLVSLVDCGARTGFSLVSSPAGFLLPDRSLYPDAVPVYRMVARDDPDRVMLAFSRAFYYNQLNVGWKGDGFLGYLLSNPSRLPSIAPPQRVIPVPVYVLHAKGPGLDRTMLAWSESEFQSQLKVGWGDAGWPKPVGYILTVQ